MVKSLKKKSVNDNPGENFSRFSYLLPSLLSEYEGFFFSLCLFSLFLSPFFALFLIVFGANFSVLFRVHQDKEWKKALMRKNLLVFAK